MTVVVVGSGMALACEANMAGRGRVGCTLDALESAGLGLETRAGVRVMVGNSR